MPKIRQTDRQADQCSDKRGRPERLENETSDGDGLIDRVNKNNISFAGDTAPISGCHFWWW